MKPLVFLVATAKEAKLVTIYADENLNICTRIEDCPDDEEAKEAMKMALEMYDGTFNGRLQ